MRHLTILLFVFLLTACAGSRPPTSPFDKSTLDAATLYLQHGDTDAAIDLLEQITSKDSSPYASYLLADIYDSTGAPELALPHYIETIAIVHKKGGSSYEATAAAMGMVAIRDRVSGFHTKLNKLFERLKDSRGLLPLEAWFQLRNLRLGLSRKTVDISERKQALVEVGCLTKWKVAGPVGPFVWSQFDEATPPSPGESWPTTLNLGPGRSQTLFRKAFSNSCFNALQNPDLPLQGLTWAHSTVVLDKAQKIHFRLQAMGGVKIFAGGKELFRQDPRSAWRSNVSWFVSEFPAGATDISVAVASTSLPPSFALVAFDEKGNPAFVDHGIETVSLGVPVSESEPTEIGIPQNILSRYAALKIALWWDNIELASQIIETFRASGEFSPAVLVLEAEAELADPSLPGDVAYEKARVLEVLALDKEPRFWQMRVNLCGRAFSDGRTVDALSLLEEGIALSPNEPELHRRLVGIFAGEGWYGQTDQALEALSELMPESCNTLEWQLAIARRTSRFEHALELASKLKQCDATSPALSEELLRAQNWGAALEERERLARRDPFGSSALIEIVRVALAGGQEDKAMASTKNALDMYTGDSSIRFLYSDMLAAKGNPKEAVENLDDGLSLSHNPNLSILNARSALLEKQLFASLRVNAKEIIDDYKAENPEYSTASVFVLDRAVYIVGPHGDMTSIVHTVKHLQTDEAIEASGEFALPAGAILLSAKTIKEDGRVLKPERIPGKSTFSMPGLEAGDFIETEYALHFLPSRIYPGGFDTDRFYFQDFDTAFHRSEMVVSVPSHIEIQVDPRGDSPHSAKQSHGDRTSYSWRVRGALPSPAEPLSPAATEYLPSVRVSSAVSWPNVLGRMRDLLADMSRPSRHIDLALEEAAGSLPDDEILRAIYDYVMSRIEPGDDMFEQASHIIVRKSGNRARAFHALAIAAGFSPRLALAKPSGLDENEGIPNFGNFQTLLVNVKRVGWLSFEGAGTSFGFLPPRLRHRPVLFVDDGEQSNTDGGRVPYDKQNIKVEIKIARDGSAEGRVKETLTGVLANDWRVEFTQSSSSEWEKRFEQRYLSSAIPGAVLSSLSVKNLRYPEAPLELVYEFSMDRFARPEGEAFSAAFPFPITLFKQIGGLPARITPLILSSWIEKEVDISVIANDFENISLKSSGNDSIDSQWGNVTKWHQKNGRSLRFGYRAKLKADRIAPNKYQEFLDFATQIDRISDMEVRLTD